MSDTDRQAVLFANDAFYTAFVTGDLEAMHAVWADTGPVSCIHPGWAALTRLEDILASWKNILANPPPVHCHAPTALVYGDTATVLCFEEITGSYLLATNIFIRRGGRWLMVHHHAGVTNATPPKPRDEDRRSIN